VSGSSTLDKAILSLLLTNATASLAGIGDAAGLQPSATAGALYISLHTASPGKDGDQSSNEIGYSGYARQPVARAATSWFVTAPTVAAPGSAWNLTAVTFPADSGASAAQTATHAGLGTSLSGAGYLLLVAPLSASVVVTAGVVPQFLSAAVLFTAD
jgi:hypothetical protein